MFAGWRIAAVSALNLFVIVGIVYYSFPTFYAPLIQEFGWQRAEVTAGLFYGLLIVGPLFGISAGLLIDRYGTKRILLAGLACAAVAFVGFSLMHALGVYYLCYFLTTVGYVSAGPIPNQVLMSRWFDRYRGRAMAIAYVGAGIGGAVAPVLAQFIIARWGWRAAMLAIAAMVALILIPATLVIVRNRPEELGLVPDGQTAVVAEGATGDAHIAALPSAAERVLTLGEAFAAPAFLLILAGSLLSIGAVGGVIQHLQLYLLDQRFSPAEAARVASLLLVSSIVGRLVMGGLADRFRPKRVMLAACLLVAGAIPLLFSSSTVYLFAIVFGFGMGADYMLIPLLTAECFGVASLGRLMGIILTTDAIAQAFTPVLVGRLYDVQKSYVTGFSLVTAMAALGAMAVACVPVAATRARVPPRG